MNMNDNSVLHYLLVITLCCFPQGRILEIFEISTGSFIHCTWIFSIFNNDNSYHNYFLVIALCCFCTLWFFHLIFCQEHNSKSIRDMNFKMNTWIGLIESKSAVFIKNVTSTQSYCPLLVCKTFFCLVGYLGNQRLILFSKGKTPE